MTLERQFQRSLEILRTLVRIDSVNPSLVPGSLGEKEIAEFLFSFFKAEGIDVQLQTVAPKRFNVVAKVTGTLPGARILLNGHLDTVSVEGMDSPFDPVEKDGRIYGRGSQDMKGGLAAAITALLALARHRDQWGGEVILAAVADEEDQSLGTQFFLNHWPKESPFQFGLIMEPTDLKVCSAHKGFAWMEVTTQGVAAHGSRPREGVDAIRAMGQVLQELDALDTRLQSGAAHPLLGFPSLHASIIQGGREWSSYPDRCLLKYERRTLPHESNDQLEGELNIILEKLARLEPQFSSHSHLVCSRAPFEVDRTHPVLESFFKTAHTLLPDLVEWGAATFWTDAALLSEACIPSLLFGPRGAGLHSLEEYVLASDVVSCAEIIYEFVRRQSSS